jgi:predicted RNase H-like nuclease (RuvC/YqgF family)
MRAECFVTLSGLVDGAEIPEALTQLRVEITGSWRLDGRTLTHRIDRATVTAIRPEMRDFAAMIETMYREISTLTADIEKWDATTVRMRDKATGEVFELVRDGRLN